MELTNLFDVIFDFFADLASVSPNITVAGNRFNLYGLLLAFLGVPAILMLLLPWYDNDDDD